MADSNNSQEQIAQLKDAIRKHMAGEDALHQAIEDHRQATARVIETLQARIADLEDRLGIN